MTAMRHPLPHQSGISLMVVMVMLLLCSLLALGAARLGWLNEALVGNISDEQRAFLAAEELMRDAQRDIETPTARPIAAGAVYFPIDATDLTQLQALVASDPVPCRNGLCFPETLGDINGTGSTNWWQQGDSRIATMRERGTRFGAVTGASSDNPLLVTARNRAHYWIEVFRYSPSGESLVRGTDPPFVVYRVTAMVDGLKSGTRVVLQSILSPGSEP